MKTISIAMILCCFTAFGQNLDEVRQYRRIVKVADSLFIEREYQKSLNLYERALKFCLAIKHEYGCGPWLNCWGVYSQIRYIRDCNLIIRDKIKYNGNQE
tara:strand:- start:15 stop:314 length:300 start_codon:yes stop_codon:yes gene_type:complete